MQEKCQDINGVIRSRKSKKYRQCNAQRTNSALQTILTWRATFALETIEGSK